MRITKILALLRHTLQRRVDVVYKTTGYNIIINRVYFYRWEDNWHKANKIVRKLQRQGIQAQMHRVVAQEAIA